MTGHLRPSVVGGVPTFVLQVDDRPDEPWVVTLPAPAHWWVPPTGTPRPDRSGVLIRQASADLVNEHAHCRAVLEAHTYNPAGFCIAATCRRPDGSGGWAVPCPPRAVAFWATRFPPGVED